MEARGGEHHVAGWVQGGGGGCWCPCDRVEFLSHNAASPDRSGFAPGVSFEVGRSAPERGVPTRTRGIASPCGLTASTLYAVACGMPHGLTISEPGWPVPARGYRPKEGRPTGPLGCKPIVPRCSAGLPVAGVKKVSRCRRGAKRGGEGRRRGGEGAPGSLGALRASFDFAWPPPTPPPTPLEPASTVQQQGVGVKKVSRRRGVLDKKRKDTREEARNRGGEGAPGSLGALRAGFDFARPPPAPPPAPLETASTVQQQGVGGHYGTRHSQIRHETLSESVSCVSCRTSTCRTLVYLPKLWVVVPGH